jgi:hypothetical protein
MNMCGLVGSGLASGFLCLALSGPVAAQAAPAPSQADTRELIDATKATAKATQESLNYTRVTPDILFQILAKLDKLENKLDKIENTLKAQQGKRGR